jgi:hypothetical protein
MLIATDKGPMADFNRLRYGAELGEFRFQNLAPGDYYVRVELPSLRIRGVRLRAGESKPLTLAPLACTAEDEDAPRLSDGDAAELLAFSLALMGGRHRLLIDDLPRAWLKRLSPDVGRVTRNHIRDLTRFSGRAFFTEAHITRRGQCGTVKIASRMTLRDPNSINMYDGWSLYRFRRHDNLWDIDYVEGAIS